MEDLDPPREVAGAADSILHTLEAHGLHWDDTPLYQSSRGDAYQMALETLIDRGHAYLCHCSRREIAAAGRRGDFGLIYPGTCRERSLGGHDERGAWRVRTHDEPIGFEDFRCGHQEQRLASEVGDFVVKRADGFWAYQLAVVVDDAHQGITEVVRGEDLLDNTPRQIHLQRLLGLPAPTYLHLPLVTNAQGQKLSKQTFAKPLDDRRASANLLAALRYLGVHLPSSLAGAAPSEVLDQASACIADPAWSWRLASGQPLSF